MTSLYSFLEDLPEEPKKKRMKCLDGIASNCAKEFLTTPEYRRCAFCAAERREQEQSAGLRSSGLAIRENMRPNSIRDNQK